MGVDTLAASAKRQGPEEVGRTVGRTPDGVSAHRGVKSRSVLDAQLSLELECLRHPVEAGRYTGLVPPLFIKVPEDVAGQSSGIGNQLKNRFPILGSVGSNPSFGTNSAPSGDKTGLPHLTLHGLRHVHATLMLEAGIHPKVVSERLGHSTVGITLDTYSHVLPSLQEQAAAVVDRSPLLDPRQSWLAEARGSIEARTAAPSPARRFAGDPEAGHPLMKESERREPEPVAGALTEGETVDSGGRVGPRARDRRRTVCRADCRLSLAGC